MRHASDGHPIILPSVSSVEIAKIGAEAVIYRLLWNNTEIVAKWRRSKQYRDASLDNRIRLSRTVHEAKLMQSAKEFGVPCPAVIFIDRENSVLYMQYVHGKPLKNLVSDSSDHWLRKTASRLGELVGKLHLAGIVHGDVTTSNILAEDSQLYLLDFGLGNFTRELEEIAVDIHLMQRTFESSHFERLKTFMEPFLDSYSNLVGSQLYQHVIARVEEIARRGRYVKRKVADGK